MDFIYILPHHIVYNLEVIKPVCQNFIKDLKSKKKRPKKDQFLVKKKTKKRPFQAKKKDLKIKKRPKKDLCVVCVVLAMQAPPYPGRKLEPIT